MTAKVSRSSPYLGHFGHQTAKKNSPRPLKQKKRTKRTSHCKPNATFTLRTKITSHCKSNATCTECEQRPNLYGCLWRHNNMFFCRVQAIFPSRSFSGQFEVYTTSVWNACLLLSYPALRGHDSKGSWLPETYLIPGCAGGGVRLGSESLSASAGDRGGATPQK